MQIFSFYPNGDGALGLVLNDLDYFQEHFIGKRMAGAWKPPTFSVQRRTRPIRDFVFWYLGVIILTEKGRKAVEKTIAPHVEFLPLAEVGGHELFAVNVITVLDCLDRQASF